MIVPLHCFLLQDAFDATKLTGTIGFWTADCTNTFFFKHISSDLNRRLPFGNACTQSKKMLWSKPRFYFFLISFFFQAAPTPLFSGAPARWASLGRLPGTDLEVIWKRVTISLEQNYSASVELHHAPLACPDTNTSYSVHHNTGHSMLAAKTHITYTHRKQSPPYTACVRSRWRSFPFANGLLSERRLFVGGRWLVDGTFSGNGKAASPSLEGGQRL